MRDMVEIHPGTEMLVHLGSQLLCIGLALHGRQLANQPLAHGLAWASTFWVLAWLASFGCAGCRGSRVAVYSKLVLVAFTWFAVFGGMYPQWYMVAVPL